MPTNTAYLSLGANLGNREETIRRAIELLQDEALRITRQSSLYDTEPQDLPDQPPFLNMVVEVETTLFPYQLLSRIHKVEAALGRKRLVPKGPRTIDIDIVLYGRHVINAADLIIPHPRMHQRRFVLAPLAEIAPNLRHPTIKQTIADMLKVTSAQRVTRIQ